MRLHFIASWLATASTLFVRHSQGRSLSRRDDHLSSHLAALEPRTPTAPVTTRTVSLVVDVSWINAIIDPQTNSNVLDSHAFVEYGPMPGNGALRVEDVLQMSPESNYVTVYVRALDRGEAATRIGETLNYWESRYVYMLPENTGLTNEEILSPQTGRGIAVDAWGPDYRYRFGAHGDYNAGNTYILSLLRKTFGPDFSPPQAARRALELGVHYSTIEPNRVDLPLNLFYCDRIIPRGQPWAGRVHRVAWDEAVPSRPRRLEGSWLPLDEAYLLTGSYGLPGSVVPGPEPPDPDPPSPAPAGPIPAASSSRRRPSDRAAASRFVAKWVDKFKKWLGEPI